MPFDVEGWIEVAYGRPDTPEGLRWFGVINLSTRMSSGDGDTERIFGLSKGYVTGERSTVAVAAARGVPPAPSRAVLDDLAQIAGHEAQYGPGEFGGYTHALWSELRELGLVESPPQSRCQLAFRIARGLEEEFGPERIRFVVWFCW
jgi:hypothetical protein